MHRIHRLHEVVHDDIEVPEFDYEEFSNIRFGVFWGEPENVKLQIDKKFKKYFVNRFWHNTQQLSEDKDDNMILKMKVPLSPELISWIISWHEAVLVLVPQTLREKVITKLKSTISMY